MENINPIPRQIETLLNTIEGELICPDCKKVLKEWGMESGNIKNLPFKDYSISFQLHICPRYKFTYDYNDPLTIKQQYERAKYEATKI